VYDCPMANQTERDTLFGMMMALPEHGKDSVLARLYGSFEHQPEHFDTLQDNILSIHETYRKS